MRERGRMRRMSGNPECALYLSVRRQSVRMVPACEIPMVQSGSQTCDHFFGTPQNIVNGARDVTNSCRRAVEARYAPPIEATFPE